MARPIKCRRICQEPDYDQFVPDGTSSEESVFLTLDEYEVIRLIDLNKMTHVQCAQQMCVAKTTVTEIYESAREKIADSIVNGKRLVIKGGHYRVCDGHECCRFSGLCLKRQESFPCTMMETDAVSANTLALKEDQTLRIAVPYENGEVYQHFGRAERFQFCDVKKEKIVREQVVETDGLNHGALPVLLANAKTDILICGGIGYRARQTFEKLNVTVYDGVSGNVEDAVRIFIEGKLVSNPDIQCGHHKEETCHCQP
ncbi:MAG: DUF134 domain-containing protein [Clostridiales bacterium]|nr:DUF134 domain-containing protein [Clostridiales bacterium]